MRHRNHITHRRQFRPPRSQSPPKFRPGRPRPLHRRRGVPDRGHSEPAWRTQRFRPRDPQSGCRPRTGPRETEPLCGILGSYPATRPSGRPPTNPPRRILLHRITPAVRSVNRGDVSPRPARRGRRGPLANDPARQTNASAKARRIHIRNWTYPAPTATRGRCWWVAGRAWTSFGSRPNICRRTPARSGPTRWCG